MASIAWAASKSQAPASEASLKVLVSTSLSWIWPQSRAASCGIWNKQRIQKTAFYPEGNGEQGEPHVGFPYRSSSTFITFRIVDRKAHGLGDNGDDLFRNPYSFASIFKVWYTPSLQFSFKRILSILEVKHHTWGVWKWAFCIQRCRAGMVIIIHRSVMSLCHLLHHLIFLNNILQLFPIPHAIQKTPFPMCVSSEPDLSQPLP